MTGAEFHAWFVDNIDEMVKIGVAHPNSEAGRWIRLAISATAPRIKQLEDRIFALEEQLKKKSKA